MKRLFLSLYAILAVWGVKAADMPYSLELSQLYIIGDATPYAWDTSKTPDMEKINEDCFDGQVTWRLARNLSSSIREHFISIS